MSGIAVAGFHRSGTSSVGQALSASGVPLGLDLMVGNEFNKHGYFEDWTVVRFHDEVLNRHDLDWARLSVSPPELSPDDLEWCRSYAKKRDEQGPIWAMKDPRMCRFVRGWKLALPDLKFVVVYRDPVESAHSVSRRAMMEMARTGDTDNRSRRFYHDPDLALRLWVDHNRHLADLVNECPDDCLVIGHHHILNGFDLLDEIEGKLGLRLPLSNRENTIDPSAISDKSPTLPVIDEQLLADAIDVWSALTAKDVAVSPNAAPRDVAAKLFHDPSGKLLRATLADIQLKQLYGRQVSVTGAKTLAARVARPPFGLYFMRRKKYRDIIEGIEKL